MTEAPRSAPDPSRTPEPDPSHARAADAEANPRPYREDPDPPPPTHAPPGVRLLTGGAIVAVLGPLAGFLGGSVVGDQGAPLGSLSPLFFFMFVGLLVGALGGIAAILGALRWSRRRHEWQAEREAEIGAARPPT